MTEHEKAIWLAAFGASSIGHMHHNIDGAVLTYTAKNEADQVVEGVRAMPWSMLPDWLELSK